MRPREAQRAVGAAIALAGELGLGAEEAVVLNDSNRLVVRLLPCDVVARVTPAAHHAGHAASAAREVELAARLAEVDGPVAPLDGRVEARTFERDGFELSWWTHLAPRPPRAIPSAEYAGALDRLHAGLRRIEVAAPHVADRLAATRRDVLDHDLTPDLAAADRAQLAEVLRAQLLADLQPHEQLLHGEPHPWNLLDAADGLCFLDFENAARGPVEYDLAWVPDAVARHRTEVDHDLVDSCRGMVLALIAVHRFRRDDEHPSGRASGLAFLDAVRRGPPYPALDGVTW